MTVREKLEQSRRARLERSMRLGPWKFVLLYGVLAGGGSMSIITLLLVLTKGTQPGALKLIPIVISLLLVGGAVFGLLLWTNLASNYVAIKEAERDHPPGNQTKETVKSLYRRRT